MKGPKTLNLRQVSTNLELAQIVQEQRQMGKTIGFVPTMGALHQGHLSLIEIAKKNSDFVVCSIFVNPTQFNNASDLHTYPRTLEKDCELLESVQCDLAYIPAVNEVYNGVKDIDFDFGPLEAVMEGAKRPGHFKGVAQVVKRLFELVLPDEAFFGLKDFQQFAIISELVRQYNLPINLHGCPIIRESNGLAMSSRNTRILQEHRDASLSLSQSLRYIQDNWESQSVKEVVSNAIKLLDPLVKLEYLEIAEPFSLTAIQNWDAHKHARAFIAGHVGEVRLIDNLELY